jgi:hypothetical protein
MMAWFETQTDKKSIRLERMANGPQFLSSTHVYRVKGSNYD